MPDNRTGDSSPASRVHERCGKDEDVSCERVQGADALIMWSGDCPEGQWALRLVIWNVDSPLPSWRVPFDIWLLVFEGNEETEFENNQRRRR